MFRKSKREKERRTTCLQSDIVDDASTNSLKRHSRLFIFGKKHDKKKQDFNSEGKYSPDTDGIRVEESFENKPVKIVTQPKKVVKGSIPFLKSESLVNKPLHNTIMHKRNNSGTSHRKFSAVSSLSFDFGTDSSMAFQSFTADVLRATEEKLKGVDLKLPDIKTTLNEDTSRTVKISRKAAGDFGFALRRSTITKGESDTKIYHLVEPSSDDNSMGLLPGDRLIEVDHKNVENCIREEIIEKIAASGTSVTLKVVPVPELSELSSRTAALHAHTSNLQKVPSLARSASLRARMSKTGKSDKDLELEKSWLAAEKVWLVHSSGFSSGRMNKVKNDNGEVVKYQVKLDHGGEVVEVEEDGVEKINPPQFDCSEDLSSLRYLNESGCLHTLRQRYAGNLTQTYAGNSLIIIKPVEKLAIYTDKVMQMFRGCKQEDMPPHIYATAQISYHSMFASNVNQSIVLWGTAGSGKTYNLKHIIKYLTTVAVSKDSNATASKMEAALSLIESFTHARTNLSHNASFGRFIYTLDFDTSGLIVGSSIQNFFLDKSRVGRTSGGQSSYRIFYELLDGYNDKLSQDLFLEMLPKEGNLFFDFEEQLFSNKEDHASKWQKLKSSVELLNISPDEMKGIWAPIATILHLGAAGITAAPGSKPYFSNPSFAQKAALILGTTEESLARIIFSSSLDHSRSNSNLSRSGSTTSRASNILSPCASESTTVLSPAGSLLSIDSVYDMSLNALEGFVSGLYVEAFTALMRLINRSLNTSSKISSVINIYDGPGFQNKLSIEKTANFEDLCANYCCEKMQWLMHFCTFTLSLDRYNRENIDCSYEADTTSSPELTIAAFDKLTVDRRISRSELSEAKGLFWIVEEEALRSNSNETMLVDKIRAQHTVNKVYPIVTTDSKLPEIFMVSHLQNTTMIQYNTTGWLKRVREHPTVKMGYGILTVSTKSYVTELYAGHQSGTFHSETISHGRGGRRRSRTAISSAKKNSTSMQTKLHMDRILEILDRTNVHFIYCFLPEPFAGLYDSNKMSKDAQSATPILDVPFVRQQIRSSYLLESMRIHRQGYPEHMAFPEFRRRFDILLSKEDRISDPVLDEKQVISNMVKKLDLEERSYRLGLSQIFLRAGTLPQLEDLRDDKLSESIIQFQAKCRGSLARKRFRTLQLQRLAIRCLQRNIRKFLLVRHWPWWRLHTKVLPLLDVHRTEQELKNKQSEVGSLHNRIEKLAHENKEYEETNARLKKKVQELSVQLSEIHSSASGASVLLEHETAERLSLEEQLEAAKMETAKLMKQRTQLESELCDMKLMSNGDYYLEDAVGMEELEQTDNAWREKYKSLTHELENTRRKINEQAEEELQELTVQKRNTEKALAEERADGDEVRRQLTNTKRKLNKLNSEMDDMELLLESMQGRNCDLEKKQRKFDQETLHVQEELEQEKSLYDTVQRERDKYSAEKHSLQNTVSEREDEISQLKRKIDRLNEEIDEFSSSGKTDAELVTMKRQLHENKVKIQDQEEELDEQAGQIQQLEQTKLRLEMASQHDKQQFERDLEAKDEEIEQLRADNQRKLRALEEQLDEEVQAKIEITKAKRDLERHVFELQSTAEEVDRGSERKLKKELKKLRILYKDAKMALENQSAKSSDQAELKALRNKLEDVEFAKHMALKAKTQIETDMEELTNQIDNITESKENMEEKCLMLSRENGDLQARIDEAEDGIADVVRNNKQLISQLSEAQTAMLDLREKFRDLLDEKDSLAEKVNHLTQKLESNRSTMVDKMELERCELKLRDIEAKLEAEITMKIKLDHQVNRLKGQLERMQDDKNELQNNHSRIQQNSARFERQVKECRIELDSLKRQESEHKRRKEEVENSLMNLEDELSRKKHELVLAEKRIRDLQESLEEEIGASSDEDLFGDEIGESDDSLTSPLSKRRPITNRQNRRSLVKRFSSDSFDTNFTSSYRPRRSEDSYISSNGLIGKDSVRSAFVSEQRGNSGISRTTSRSASRSLTRQGSID